VVILAIGQIYLASLFQFPATIWWKSYSWPYKITILPERVCGGWKGHCRVLKLSVFFKTGGKYDDKTVLRGYWSDVQVLWEKHPGICLIVLTPVFHFLPVE
jgi:hypothetical protein